MAVLILEKEGKIKADDFVSQYIPAFPAYAKNVRIRHLLHHQGGLPNYNELCKNSKTPVQNKEIISYLNSQSKLEFEPGSRYQYSNMGYVVLAEVAAHASGQSFSDFLNEHIFKKIKMNHTDLITLENEAAFQKKMHSYKAWPFFDVNDNGPCNYKQGPGSIVTNLDDFSKWIGDWKVEGQTSLLA